MTARYVAKKREFFSGVCTAAFYDAAQVSAGNGVRRMDSGSRADGQPQLLSELRIAVRPREPAPVNENRQQLSKSNRIPLQNRSAPKIMLSSGRTSTGFQYNTAHCLLQRIIRRSSVLHLPEWGLSL